MPLIPQSEVMLKNTRHYTLSCYDNNDRRKKKQYVVVSYNFIGTHKMCKQSAMFVQNKYRTQCFCFEKTEEFEIQKGVHF